MSFRLPPVSPTVSGLPRPQTIRWCLEPLRERSTGLGPVLAPPKRPHVRAVDRRSRPVDPLRLVELREQQLVQLLPDAGLLPLAQPAPAGHPRAAAHLLRQVLPRGSPSAARTRSRSAPSGPRSASDREPMPPRHLRDQRLKQLPQLVRRPTASPSSPSFRTRLTTPASSANRGSRFSLGALKGSSTRSRVAATDRPPARPQASAREAPARSRPDPPPRTVAVDLSPFQSSHLQDWRLRTRNSAP